MEGDQRRNGEAEMSEDEKMEKFYALIKSYKEARDRHRRERERSSDREDEERRKRMRVGRDREESSWIPAFKWEDFAADKADMEFRCRPAVKLKEGEKSSGVKDPPPEVDGGGSGGGLDLKLRL